LLARCKAMTFASPQSPDCELETQKTFW